MSDELIAEILRRLTELEAKVKVLEETGALDPKQIAYRVAELMRLRSKQDGVNSALPHQVSVVLTDSLL